MRAVQLPLDLDAVTNDLASNDRERTQIDAQPDDVTLARSTQTSRPAPSTRENDMSDQSSPGMHPRAGFVIGLLIGLVFLTAGLIVGFTGHGSTSSSRFCGSVLGGSNSTDLSTAALCDRVLSGPTIWTWVLIACAVLAVVVGVLVTVMMSIAEKSAGPTPTTA